MRTNAVDLSARIAEQGARCLAVLAATLLGLLAPVARATAEVPAGASSAIGATTATATTQAAAVAAAAQSATTPQLPSTGAAASAAAAPPSTDTEAEAAVRAPAQVTGSAAQLGAQATGTPVARVIDTATRTASGVVAPVSETVTATAGGEALKTAAQNVRAVGGMVVQTAAQGARRVSGSAASTVGAAGATVIQPAPKLPIGAVRPPARDLGDGSRVSSSPSAHDSSPPAPPPGSAGADARNEAQRASSVDRAVAQHRTPHVITDTVGAQFRLGGAQWWLGPLALTSLGSLAPGTRVGARHASASAIHAPAPTPGGLGGASAGSSGFGAPIFLSLLALLLLGVPAVRGRLRLLRLPWSIPPCILVPERPG